MSVFSDYALHYLEAGWFPIPVDTSKRPYVSGYTGREGKWTSAADIYRWSDEFPKAHIALRLNQDVIGIDVDAYDGKAGEATLAALEAAHGPLPPTLISTARDDGVSGIRLFLIPAYHRDSNWPGKAGDAIEVITWYERYMIVAPSLHTKAGRNYRWCKPDFTPRRFPGYDGIAELPQSWADALADSASAAEGSQQAPSGVREWLKTRGTKACPGMAATFEHWAGTLANAVDAGGAHEAARDGIRAILGDALAGHTGGLKAVDGLSHNFLEAVEGRRTAREARAEIRRMTEGGIPRSAGRNALAAAPADPCAEAAELKAMRPVNRPEAAGAQLPGATVLSEPGTHGAAYRKELASKVRDLRILADARRVVRAEAQQPIPDFVTLDAALSTPLPPVKFRIDGVMPSGANVLLTAQYKAGKTTLVNNLVRSLADGDEFLGVFDCGAQPDGSSIVIVDSEMQEPMLYGWLQEQNISKMGMRNITIVSLQGRVSAFNITDPEVRAEWAKRFKAAKVGVLILDCMGPMMTACGLDERADANVFLAAVDELKRECGARELVLVHHMGHAAERARGDSRILGWYTVEWKLIRTRDESNDDDADPSKPRYFMAYGRGVEVPETKVSFAAGFLTLSGGSRRADQMTSALQPVADYVRMNPGSSLTAIREGCESVSNIVVGKVLRDMISDGSVCVHKSGKSSLHYPSRGCPEPSAHESSKQRVSRGFGGN